jgi:hypothetical protein
MEQIKDTVHDKVWRGRDDKCDSSEASITLFDLEGNDPPRSIGLVHPFVVCWE